jgi:hypothetical protein
VKTAEQWQEELRLTHYGPEPKAGIDANAFVLFLRAVQRDARDSGPGDKVLPVPFVATPNERRRRDR